MLAYEYNFFLIEIMKALGIYDQYKGDSNEDLESILAAIQQMRRKVLSYSTNLSAISK